MKHTLGKLRTRAEQEKVIRTEGGGRTGQISYEKRWEAESDPALRDVRSKKEQVLLGGPPLSASAPQEVCWPCASSPR